MNLILKDIFWECFIGMYKFLRKYYSPKRLQSMVVEYQVVIRGWRADGQIREQQAAFYMCYRLGA
jgi:hypothetical protein